ncbi:MAG: YobA family protein [Paenibacillus sp.]|nr:YobA family protein [Paenibacillus sp.]
MKKGLLYMLLIVSILSLISCNETPTKDPNLLGRVVDIDGGRILVISKIAREEITSNIKDLLNSGKYTEAYWVIVSSSKKYKIGDQVKVWFSQSEDSYPAQTKADKIEIVPE